MCYFGFGFSESPERVGINLVNHERDWIYLTKDLGINMSLEEFDSLTRKRISRIIHIQEKKIEQENEIKKKQYEEAERRARRQQQQANNSHRTSQRINY